MDQTLIGAYGAWAASLMGEAPRPLSFRHNSWTDLDAWRAAGRARLAERLAAPNLGAAPAVTVERVGEHEGLHVEELTWQLPMGPPTRAYFLKPAGATGRLPGLLALHDHGGLKFFGRRKIADVASFS